MPAKFQMSTQTVAIVAIEFYYWKGRVYITSLIIIFHGYMNAYYKCDEVF